MAREAMFDTVAFARGQAAYYRQLAASFPDARQRGRWLAAAEKWELETLRRAGVREENGALTTAAQVTS